MAKFGFMSKALAGAGQGLQLAGQLGFQAKLQGDLEAQRAESLAKRDEVLQRYEGGRLDRELGARATEGAANRATQREGFMTQKAAHLEGIDKQLQAKDNKVDFKDGVAFLNGVPNEELTKSASALSKQYGTAKTTDLLQNMQGLVDKKVAPDYTTAFNMLKPQDADAATKADEAVMKRLNMLKDLAKSRMGVDFFQKLNDDEREQFDAIFIDAARNSRTMPNIEDAYESAIKKWNSVKSTKTVTEGTGGGLSDERKKELDILIGR